MGSLKYTFRFEGTFLEIHLRLAHPEAESENVFCCHVCGKVYEVGNQTPACWTLQFQQAGV